MKLAFIPGLASFILLALPALYIHNRKALPIELWTDPSCCLSFTIYMIRNGISLIATVDLECRAFPCFYPEASLRRSNNSLLSLPCSKETTVPFNSQSFLLLALSLKLNIDFTFSTIFSLGLLTGRIN